MRSGYSPASQYRIAILINFTSYKNLTKSLFKIKTFKSLKEVMELVLIVKNFKNPKQVMKSFFGFKNFSTVMASFSELKTLRVAWQWWSSLLVLKTLRAVRK